MPESTPSKESSAQTSSRRSSSSRAASSRVTSNVDTQQSRINERASQAEAAVSDPGALSSQDWSELLSSSSQPSSGAAGAVSDASSSASSTASQGGGVSALLIGGIILIILGVAGIGYFVYAQFFAGRRRRMDSLYDDELPVDISSYSTGNTEPIPQEFEDISSNSTPLEHVRPAGTVQVKKPGAAAKKSPAGAKTPEGQQSKPSAKPAVKPEPSDRDATMPIPQPPVQRAEPAAPLANGAPKAQATPVQKSDFDWEKFFNDNDQ